MRRPRPAELEFTLRFEFPEIRDFSKPSVTLHKNGRYLLFKANDILAADVLRELDLRMKTREMREGKYFGLEGVRIDSWQRVELWRHLQGDITKHPYCKFLRTYGVEVGTSPTLMNYIRKEYPRRMLEATPYSAAEITNADTSLFQRCSVGTNLLCTDNYPPPAEDGEEFPPIFEKGQRYMVVRTSGDGLDKVGICTTPMKDGAELQATGEGSIYQWSEIDPAMELYFDDSENIEFGADIRQVYPDRIRAMERKLASLEFIRRAVENGETCPLYEHVAIDAVEEALKRGSCNCKLMRMGKTSEAITIVKLWGSKRVAVIGTKNVRLAWRAELKRLGFKDEDFVMVNRLEDLNKTGTFYLMTYEWVKSQKDLGARARKDNEGYLRPARREVTRTVTFQSKSAKIEVYDANPCPHCDEPMERFILERDSTGKHTKTTWTTEKGYICRNPECTQTPKRGEKPRLPGKGAAWAMRKPVRHAAGAYVDYGLAAHAGCSGERIHGRMCEECRVADGEWVPPRYRRFKDSFTAVVGDEIHNAKDWTAQASRAMYVFRARRRLAMTGTFLSNSPTDAFLPLYWAIGGPRDGASGDFPYYHIASKNNGKKEFEKRFVRSVYLEKATGEVDEETGEEIKKIVKKQTPFLINPPDWWRCMQPKVKRRNYDDPLFKASLIAAGMKQPKIDQFTVKCPMHPKQIRLMLDALQDFKKQYELIKQQAEAKNQEVNPAMVIAKMTALRKIATVPERLNQEFRTKTGLDQDIYTGPAGGGKMTYIKNRVDAAVAEGKKVLIISDFILMQVNCDAALQAYHPIRLLTSWPDDKRFEAVTAFREDPERKVFIAGTRAIGDAIDLSPADVTICCDLLWSPAKQKQAWSRAMAPTLRDRTCTVYLMLSENSLDEHIAAVFYGKMTAEEQAMDRRVMDRRAMEFNVKWFVERIIEEEEALIGQLRDDINDAVIFAPQFEDQELTEARV